MTVNPRYFPAHGGTGAYADVSLVFERDDASIELYGSPEKQRITIARTVGDNVVAPSISRSAGGGNVVAPTISWRHNVGDASSVITNFSPKENINVQWTDGAWLCNVDAPIQKNRLQRMKVSVKRKIDF